jgi:carbamoyltransferase
MKTNWRNYHNIHTSVPTICNPTVLGFSAYFHDSSACIVKDGKVLAAVEEERFTRKKHDNSFPVNAIKYCLSKIGRAPDLVVFFENPDRKFDRIKQTFAMTEHSDEIYRTVFTLWDEVKSRKKIEDKFSQTTGLDNQIIFLDHHLSHAASAYYVSGYNNATLVTIDGVGENTTTTIGRGDGLKIEMLKEIEFPHSIGLLYTALTVFLGFRPFDGEYKVMGLAAYGDDSRESNPYYRKLRQTLQVAEDGSFGLNMRYFGHNNLEMKAYRPELVDLLGLPPRHSADPMNGDYENLAAALQLLTEDLVLGILTHAYQIAPSESLCFAGGVALNSVINAKILTKTKFKRLFIQPAAGDGGTALGAAKYVQCLADNAAPSERMSHAYLGPGYTTDEIENVLNSENIVYHSFASEVDKRHTVAALLKAKNVVGWFWGRIEWGPRALGARSILASPLYEDMKDILNAKVKHREMFRPFAPVVCVDDAEEFFECDLPIPEPTDFMLMVYPIRKEKQRQLPAVVHVDGSGRLQTIRRDQNPEYYDLVKEFGRQTGTPVLINTSFNINNEPIVCSPLDALNCMRATKIDYLVIDRFLVRNCSQVSS